MAVHLDAATRAAVADAATGLRAHAGSLAVSWVAPDNFHVTLKFLGGVDEARVPTIVAALRASAARHATFVIDVRGLGAFPSVTRPRVLWAGVGEGREPLGALAASVDRAMSALGFASEERGFSAHVTVGRVRTPARAPELAAALQAAAPRLFGRVEVRDVALMRSDLSPRGARYTTLATLPLGAAVGVPR